MKEKWFGTRKLSAHEASSLGNTERKEEYDAKKIEVREHTAGPLSFASATRSGTIRNEAKENQDSVLIGDSHLAVADGMGGHEAGKEASQTIIRMFDYQFEGQTALSLDDWRKRGKRFVAEANSRMQALKIEAGRETSGTTFTGAVLETQQVLRKNPRLEKVVETKEISGQIFGMLLHVGDSRAYIFEREGNLRQITIDEDPLYSIMRNRASETLDLNTLRVQMRDMQKSLEHLSHGEKMHQLRETYGLTEEEIELYENSRQGVSAAFGEYVDEDPQITFFQLRPGDTLIIQSDGLDVLTNEERKAIIETALDEAYAAETLVSRAMEKVQEIRARGGKIKDDDMTVALVKNTYEATETV